MYINAGKAFALVGGQFGSEAKGLVASHIALQEPGMNRSTTICTTNAGAQAGHTTILPNGTKFICYHLPTIGVLFDQSTIYLNAGSIIDLDLLRHEIMAISNILMRPLGDIASRIVIHPNAAVITNAAKETEQTATVHLGSTQKGVGAALANKIMRVKGATMGTMFESGFWPMAGYAPGIPIVALNLNDRMYTGAAVTIEIPQGTGLSLSNGDFYPKCTSRDCWVGQGIADAGINPKYLENSAMVCRTYPIRVGHIYDATGQKVGDSGGWYPDSTELSWAENFPKIEPERTTVTKRVRRIASWSSIQYRSALSLNCPSHVFITFVNYFSGPQAFAQFMRALNRVHFGVGMSPEMLFSWGPASDQVGNYSTAMDWLMERDHPKTIHNLEE